jgi:hypothetical protein
MYEQIPVSAGIAAYVYKFRTFWFISYDAQFLRIILTRDSLTRFLYTSLLSWDRYKVHNWVGPGFFFFLMVYLYLNIKK